MIIKTIKNSIISAVRSHSAKAIFAGVMATFCLAGVLAPSATVADYDNHTSAVYVAKEVVKKIKVVVTAYSSTPDQTDDTPFITASGKTVADGIVANNMLPFGTEIRIPELYGDKVFVVQDRMNRRKSNYHFDVWMPDRASAVDFGVKTVEIEVLES